MSSKLSPVPFHGHTLFILSHQGEPYTPMKTIVESMGMDWTTQKRKIKTNQARWKGVMMPSVAKDGRARQALCLPIRMLPAFFASINPNKVHNPDTRKQVVLFQKECDNALWDYWNSGSAINPRTYPAPASVQKEPSLLDFIIQAQKNMNTPIDLTPVKLRQNIVHKLVMPTSLNPSPGELAVFNNLVHSIDRSVRDVEDALLQMQAGLRDLESFVRMISKS
ncbi:phage antirepressor N-terminal domain-containing protein [Maridesulfovibrio sp.]|uniref:phage antirepressor N-terminal domain-containing protein n=1 Tax=Maridesulfovibrio sp. TaxID=2795000 RepID=UPI002AA6EE25|nr:phage antirepressor N-terminal domain-containing protein [Maridesulfovibrio sp.]